MVSLLDIEIVESEPGGVAIVELITDIGTITVIGEFRLEGATLVVRGVHVQGLWAGAIGLGGLYQIGCAVLRRLGDVDAIRIHGARRTTGKTAGKIPRTIAITPSRCRAKGLG